MTSEPAFRRPIFDVALARVSEPRRFIQVLGRVATGRKDDPRAAGRRRGRAAHALRVGRRSGRLRSRLDQRPVGARAGGGALRQRRSRVARPRRGTEGALLVRRREAPLGRGYGRRRAEGLDPGQLAATRSPRFERQPRRSLRACTALALELRRDARPRSGSISTGSSSSAATRAPHRSSATRVAGGATSSTRCSRRRSRRMCCFSRR